MSTRTIEENFASVAMDAAGRDSQIGATGSLYLIGPLRAGALKYSAGVLR